MIRIADNVITGADRKLKLYFYYSPVSGKNIVRACTSLTGERVKKDAAFRGFRESGNRMKEASPIAAALYKMIPAEVKQYSLYRLLTGEALKMLKAGSNAEIITRTLKEIHIDPLLFPPARERIRQERTRPGNSDNKPGRLADITRYFPIDSASPRKTRIRRHRQMERLVKNPPARGENLQHIASNLLISETVPEAEQTMSKSDHRISIIDNTRNKSLQQTPITKAKYPGLMYRCRLHECKKLKLWIRSSCFPGNIN
jgi:hypothetical protein